MIFSNLHFVKSTSLRALGIEVFPSFFFSISFELLMLYLATPGDYYAILLYSSNLFDFVILILLPSLLILS